MWWEEYNKPYTHEYKIGEEWFPCHLYDKQDRLDEGFVIVLSRNRSLIDVRNNELREIVK
jgi:hypothetical protein